MVNAQAECDSDHSRKKNLKKSGWSELLRNLAEESVTYIAVDVLVRASDVTTTKPDVNTIVARKYSRITDYAGIPGMATGENRRPI